MHGWMTQSKNFVIFMWKTSQKYTRGMISTNFLMIFPILWKIYYTTQLVHLQILQLLFFVLLPFINTKYLVVNFQKVFQKITFNPVCHDHFLVLWVACHNKRAIPMTVEIFFLMIPRHGKKKKKGTSCHFFHNQ